MLCRHTAKVVHPQERTKWDKAWQIAILRKWLVLADRQNGDLPVIAVLPLHFVLSRLEPNGPETSVVLCYTEEITSKVGGEDTPSLL